MNIYYLKKFRKIAQRRLKIKVHNGTYDLMLRISSMGWSPLVDWKPLKDWVNGGFMSYNNLPYAIDMLKKERRAMIYRLLRQERDYRENKKLLEL